jgi:type III secretion protein U
MSEKTEQPTPHRLEEARKKGQLARSRLLSGAAVTLAATLAALALLPRGAVQLKALAVQMLSGGTLDSEVALRAALSLVVQLGAPVLLAAFLASALVSTAFAGWKPHPAHLMPQLERISPAAGLRRLLSLGSVGEVMKGLAVAALMLWLVWTEVQSSAGASLASVRLPGGLPLVLQLEHLGGLLARGAWVLLVLGLLDWMWARHRHLQSLKMTREEVKQEHKQSEGDPHHKSQRKSLHRQLAASGPARGVQRATVVVVNPTHIAVALRYEASECEAPYLVARAREEDALQLRREAKRLGIPVVKDIPLARSLIHYDVGEPIPEELYQAAAAVLAVAQQRDTHPGSRT